MYKTEGKRIECEWIMNVKEKQFELSSCFRQKNI